MKKIYILYYCLAVLCLFLYFGITATNSPLHTFVKSYLSNDSTQKVITTADATNDAKNRELFTNECKQGNAKSCYNLGLMFVDGKGGKEDLPKAAELFTKACDNGDLSACSDLSFMFLQGHGVKLNLGRAAELFDIICSAGNAQGCNNLGIMYYNGSGVEQNDEIALGLFTKACDMNNTKGCENNELYTQKIKEKNELKELEK